MATLTTTENIGNDASVAGSGVIAGCDFPANGQGYMRIAVLVSTQVPPSPVFTPLYLLVGDPTWAPPPGTAALAEGGAVAWSGVRFWVVGPPLPGRALNWREYVWDDDTALYREGWH